RLSIQRGQDYGGLLELSGSGRQHQRVRDRLGNDTDGQRLLFGESGERLGSVSGRDGPQSVLDGLRLLSDSGGRRPPRGGRGAKSRSLNWTVPGCSAAAAVATPRATAVARSARGFIRHPSGLREKAGRIPSAKNGARRIRRWAPPILAPHSAGMGALAGQLTSA